MYLHSTACIYTAPHVFTQHRMYLHSTACIYTAPHVFTQHRMYLHSTACIYTAPHVFTQHRNNRVILMNGLEEHTISKRHSFSHTLFSTVAPAHTCNSCEDSALYKHLPSHCLLYKQDARNSDERCNVITCHRLRWTGQVQGTSKVTDCDEHNRCREQVKPQTVVDRTGAGNK